MKLEILSASLWELIVTIITVIGGDSTVISTFININIVLLRVITTTLGLFKQDLI